MEDDIVVPLVCCRGENVPAGGPLTVVFAGLGDDGYGSVQDSAKCWRVEARAIRLMGKYDQVGMKDLLLQHTRVPSISR